MTGREKIIVGLAVLAVGWGAWELGFAPRPGGDSLARTTGGLQSLESFIAKVAEATNKEDLSDTDAYIIRLAESEWAQDPMVVIAENRPARPAKPVEQRETLPRVDLVYTGYLKMGDRQLAIVNGAEYEAGDVLEPGALLIRRVYPDKLEVEATEHGGKVFFIPLTETE